MGSFGSLKRIIDSEYVGMIDYFVDGLEIKFGYNLLKFFNNIVEEVDDLFGLVGKFGLESWVLGGDINRISVFNGC